MAKDDTLHLPPFARYDCVMCGWCCKQYDITFSAEDYKRLSAKDWARLAPQAVARGAWATPTGRKPPRDPWRLATQADGRCAFLGDDGRCLMHEHTTETGKALACAAYPFTIAATPSGVYVGLRHSCKSVAEGTGQAVETRRPFVEKLARRLAEEGHHPVYGPAVSFDQGQVMDWEDYLMLEDALVATLLRADMDMTRRVVMAWRVVSLVAESGLVHARGRAFREGLGRIVSDLGAEFPKLRIPRPALKGRERIVFRQFVNIFHRRAPPGYFNLSLPGKARERWRWFMDGVRFARGKGSIRLRDTERAIRIEDVERVRLAPLDEDQSRMLSRYLACKLFGKQVFGALFFNYDFRPGFTFLVCAYDAVLWMARALALAAGRDTVATPDLAWAIRHVDFCYNY
nr:YkgJ family cysteine cluster protein [Candidatus Brocadiia bacterium]